MTEGMRIERGVTIRLTLSVLLALLAVGLFLLGRPTLKQRAEEMTDHVSGIAASVDRDVDSVLVHFGVERGWIRKRTIVQGDADDTRIERRVTIPPGIPSVEFNLAFSALARHYDGRAVATENLKEGSVTIHIELDKRIVQTIILVMKPGLKGGGGPVRQTNV